jgi:hypothetical protein
MLVAVPDDGDSLGSTSILYEAPVIAVAGRSGERVREVCDGHPQVERSRAFIDGSKHAVYVGVTGREELRVLVAVQRPARRIAGRTEARHDHAIYSSRLRRGSGDQRLPGSEWRNSQCRE